MSSGIFNFDDIQAADNRRQEVAVLGGARPSDLMNQRSELREIFEKFVEETRPSAAEQLAEYQKTHPLPGYNFVPPSDSEEDSKKSADEAKKEQERLSNLVEEANKNEYEVTDTSTGLPKAPPVYTEEEQEALDKRKRTLAESKKREAEATAKGIPTAPTSLPKGAVSATDQQKKDAEKK